MDQEFSPDIFEKIKIPEFKNDTELIIFLIEHFNKNMEKLEATIKLFHEDYHRKFYLLITFLTLLCPTLDIKFAELWEKAKADMDQNWEYLKQVEVDCRDLKKKIDGIFKNGD